MIVSMGVLYSRISPTIFGFEATTQANNQEFVVFSIANSVTDLVSSAEDSQNRVKIISKEAIYSLNTGFLLDFNISDDSGPLFSLNFQIGSFTANVSAEFQGRSGTIYFGRNTNEDTFVNHQNTTSSNNFVSKVKYIHDEARFSIYFRWIRGKLTKEGSETFIIVIHFFAFFFFFFLFNSFISCG